MGLYGNDKNVYPTENAKYLKLGRDTIKVQGMDAYEIAVKNGYKGTEVEWLASLVGPQGDTGAQGPVGSPMSVWVGSQAQYDALGTYDDETLYFVV